MTEDLGSLVVSIRCRSVPEPRKNRIRLDIQSGRAGSSLIVEAAGKVHE
ncbi:MAG: hypothetical protein ABR999_10895 [Methanoregula sp.]